VGQDQAVQRAADDRLAGKQLVDEGAHAARAAAQDLDLVDTFEPQGRVAVGIVPDQADTPALGQVAPVDTRQDQTRVAIDLRAPPAAAQDCRPSDRATHGPAVGLGADHGVAAQGARTPDQGARPRELDGAAGHHQRLPLGRRPAWGKAGDRLDQEGCEDVAEIAGIRPARPPGARARLVGTARSSEPLLGGQRLRHGRAEGAQALVAMGREGDDAGPYLIQGADLETALEKGHHEAGLVRKAAGSLRQEVRQRCPIAACLEQSGEPAEGPRIIRRCADRGTEVALGRSQSATALRQPCQAQPDRRRCPHAVRLSSAFAAPRRARKHGRVRCPAVP
jgi:hypothetical protein